MLPQTGVTFSCDDAALQKLFDEAERKCLHNLKDFGADTVLVEGGGYEKIWLETQPMGGEMYWKRNMTAAMNNQLLFMRTQRADGRIAGSIQCHPDGTIEPQFNKFQGFCFPLHALNMWYLSGKEPAYLDMLADCLEKFDAYLWKTRDSDGDGCLESFCVYDTGEDNALRYGHAPVYCTTDTPPEDADVVPMASMDVTSFSYACRDTLAEISRLRGDGRESEWREKADAVAANLKARLWDDKRHACFDRDKSHRPQSVLTHNTLRCMYWNSLPAPLAARFVKEHLCNPAEFWTPMPLPSVAVNDPLFRNVTTNNWSGQAEALTYQRAIRALENYGFYMLIPTLGRKLMQAIGSECRFVQQYDPFTGTPSVICEPGQPPQDAYGPAMLSVLEYTARLYGVSPVRDTLVWGSCSGAACRYTQTVNDHSWEIVNSGHGAEAFVDGRKVFTAGPDLRITTDLQGHILRADRYGQDADVHDIKL